MSDPYLGEIQAFAFPYTGGFNNTWVPCFGQLLSIQQFSTLFSLLGITYGGNGTTNFGLPNLNGFITNGQGNGPGLQPRSMGDVLGSPTVTLNVQQMGSHAHGLQLGAKTATGAQLGPGAAGTSAAIDPVINGFVAPPTNVNLATNAITFTGQGQAHDNMQPYQAIVWYIATSGIYPSFGEA
jgi:microcystin-dependent protein